jgi:tRNA (cytidine/uridine-2'-O-)-methyltransferase
MLHIVLVRPEIPQNAGNIARTCAATGARLHLIKPLGFILSDRHWRRAGVDYWGEVDLVTHEDWPEFETGVDPESLFFFSRKAARRYDEAEYGSDAHLVFGCESDGLDDDMLRTRRDRGFRIPMRPGARSLNLANAAAVVVYEAARQNGFAGLV